MNPGGSGFTLCCLSLPWKGWGGGEWRDEELILSPSADSSASVTLVTMCLQMLRLLSFKLSRRALSLLYVYVISKRCPSMCLFFNCQEPLWAHGRTHVKLQEIDSVCECKKRKKENKTSAVGSFPRHLTVFIASPISVGSLRSGLSGALTQT